MAARKTDMVKIWLDGAGGLMPKLKPDIYSVVIDEAHKNGLRVAKSEASPAAIGSRRLAGTRGVDIRQSGRPAHGSAQSPVFH